MTPILEPGKQLYAPNGLEIVGTLEVLAGRADATSVDKNGDPEHEGSTDVWWEEQKTVVECGQSVWIDSDGGEWLQRELTTLKPQGSLDAAKAEVVARVEAYYADRRKGLKVTVEFDADYNINGSHAKGRTLVPSRSQRYDTWFVDLERSLYVVDTRGKESKVYLGRLLN